MLGSVSSATLAASAVPVCVFRASLPSPSEEELAVRAKLGDADQKAARGVPRAQRLRRLALRRGVRRR